MSKVARHVARRPDDKQWKLTRQGHDDAHNHDAKLPQVHIQKTSKDSTISPEVCTTFPEKKVSIQQELE